jgi:inosine/xanthosine triphosphate pyrophosphatase family protein
MERHIPQATYQDAELILKLYDIRREEKLRTARAWFTKDFSAGSVSELMEKYPPGSEQNAYFRMVISYWDMAASLVVRGILHEELFFESSGEMLFVFEKVRPLIEEFRKAQNNPMIGRNLEKASMKYIDWMNQNAPGAYETFLERMIRPNR